MIFSPPGAVVEAQIQWKAICDVLRKINIRSPTEWTLYFETESEIKTFKIYTKKKLVFVTKRLLKVNSKGRDLDIRKVKPDGNSEMQKGTKRQECDKYAS